MKAKKKKTLFIIGVIAMLIGISVIGVFGWKRISREIEKQRLLKECVVFEIPDLEIKAPVMDGTEHEVLQTDEAFYIKIDDMLNNRKVIYANGCLFYQDRHNSYMIERVTIEDMLKEIQAK